MAEVRIADLNLETSPATDDEVAIEDVSEGDTNKVTVASLLALIDDASAPQAISPTWTNPHTFSAGLTSNGDVTLGMVSNQNWKVTDGGSGRLMLESQASNTQTQIEVRSADSDGTDFVGIVADNVGQISMNDREFSSVRWDGGNDRFEVTTGSAGTGSVRPIHVYAGSSNTNQIVARTDGNVAMANKLKVGGTGAASDTIEVRGTFNFREDGSGVTNIGSFRNLSAADLSNEIDIAFRLLSNGGETAFAGLRVTPFDITDGSSTGQFQIVVRDNGSLNEQFLVTGNATSIKTPNSATGTTLVTAGSGLNEIKRDSSSRRYKSDITPIGPEDVDPARVLAIDPVHYLRDGEIAETGFVAEDFAFGPFDDGLHYEDGKVEGFRAGSRVIDAAQQVVLQDHERHLREADRLIEAVRGRQDEQEARVEALKDEIERLGGDPGRVEREAEKRLAA